MYLLFQALQFAPGNEQLLPSVTNFLSSLDLVAKKLATWFISHHRGQPDLLILTVNSLTKDCSSPNPQVRCLALKTLTLLSHSDFVEYSQQAILKGLGDDSAYVRRAAVVACAKLNELNTGLVDESSIVDTLYAMIRDKDPIVVVNVLQVLDEILATENGIVINKNIAYYLLNHLKMFDHWQILVLIKFIKRYQPKTGEEVYDIMNLLDSYLKTGNASTVVELCNYFIKLTADLPHVQADVMKHAKDPLLHNLKSSNPELTCVLIDCVKAMYIPKYVHELQGSFASFLCKQKEPNFLKIKRVQVLTELITDGNVQDIVDELILYTSSSTADLSKYVIDGIFQISQKKASYHSICINRLVHLLEVGSASVRSQTFTVLSKMDLRTLSATDQHKLMEHVGNVLNSENDSKTLPSLLWMVGENGHLCENMPYILESFVEDFLMWDKQEVCDSLLIASVKLLVKKPAEYQAIVGETMECAVKMGTRRTKESVMYYYNLLKENPSLVRTAVL